MDSSNVSSSYKIPWNILIIAIILNFCTWAFLFVTPPMETILSANLHISHFQTSLLFSAPILMIAIVAIPAGIIADRIGLKRAIGIGAIIACGSAVLRGTVSTYSGLLILSLIFGFGMGWTFANLPKLARSCSSSQQTSFVMGIINGFGLLAGIGTALAITVPVIYPLTNSYQGVFYLWSVPLLIATILWWIMVREPPCPSAEVEMEKAGSIGLKGVLKDKTLWLLAFILLLHNIFFYTWSGWLPTYLLQKGVSLSFTGLLTSVMLWIGIPTVISVPMLFSRINISKRLLIWVPSLIFAFLAIWIIYASEFSIWFIMAIAGVINILRFNTLLSLPVEIMPKEHAGVAGGVVVAIGYIGAVIGPSMTGQILDITGSFQIVFVVLAVLSLITMGLTFLIPSNNGKEV
ncbi:CynX/NimT family MFS transporter [Methanobacterium sp.]|uniref:MFS transporter n=1 Tax=Methanobacterium sp. TaxID=2164 RepID=UPI003C77F963